MATGTGVPVSGIFGYGGASSQLNFLSSETHPIRLTRLWRNRSIKKLAQFSQYYSHSSTALPPWSSTSL